MKDVYDLLKEHEANLEEFIEWQINHGPTNDFRAFAELNVKAQDIFKYASVLYPKFILVEESVVLKDHYSDDNWKEWRKTHDSKSAANIINHVHMEDYLPNDYEGTLKVEDGLGDLLAFFWKIAANHQYPDKEIEVEYNGDVINIFNI